MHHINSNIGNYYRSTVLSRVCVCPKIYLVMMIVKASMLLESKLSLEVASNDHRGAQCPGIAEMAWLALAEIAGIVTENRFVVNMRLYYSVL